MTRISFESLDIEVDKLYAQNFEETDETKIDAHCLYIAQFINACGWTEEEYLRRLFGFDQTN